ncbi:MAG: SDR family NAD(P)-dependent oxidoreductase [Chloroflexota bacterium]
MKKTTNIETNTPNDPIAIIGMGCRFPGNANSPDAFWEVLRDGVDTLGEIPADRWDVDAYYDEDSSDSVPGTMYVRTGSFLSSIDQFDPQFFRMSPREVASLDPQQRLTLEVTWEALEHAGIAPQSLRGSQTGVFTGIFWDDYSGQRLYASTPEEIGRYTLLSQLRGLTAGRIAHTLDLHGPVMPVDSACSSSLLALHLACQSLHIGECDLALAGGVSLIVSPESTIALCQSNALAPDGRCKTFDAAADGFGRGEGCGMVVLKRLSDAQRDGDPILALVRGTAINHDGHSRTVTTPNGLSQRALLKQALENADLVPNDIQYIEAHGTGTTVGDPIEVMSIARTLCLQRETPLMLGSVKANIGHLDAAAGIASVLKMVLCLQHGEIPPQPHVHEPTPRIPWQDWPLAIPATLTPWAAETRRAGISSFGMSGTNVHAILEQAPVEEPVEGQHTTATTNPEPAHHLLTLSAMNQETLQDLAKNYATHLAHNPQQSLADIGYTTATGRNHFNQRLAVVAESTAQAGDELTQFATQGQTGAWSFATEGRPKRPKIAFLCTGQGAQSVGMGKELYATQPIFRYWLDRCADILTGHLDKPLLEVLWPEDDADDKDAIHQTMYTQPALFAIEYALAQLWLSSWGITPSVLMGHSVGEYVAACLADVFTLEDGLKLIAKRGALMQSLPAGGAMLNVFADEKTVAQMIAPYPDTMSIAAINGPTSIVISGVGTAIDEIAAELDRAQIKTRPLAVSHAFHSPLMSPILAEFAQVAEGVSYAKPQIPLISNVTGQLTDGTNAEYWVRHLRDAVRFADGMTTLHEMKVNTFIEIGPKPTLLGMGRRCLPEDETTQALLWLPSLRPNAEWPTMLSSVAQLYVQGGTIDWSGFQQQDNVSYEKSRSEHSLVRGVHRESAPHFYKKVALPTYPWRRQRYWQDVTPKQPANATMDSPAQKHPLLHSRIASPLKSIFFTTTLSADNPPYLREHQVLGQPTVPAVVYVEMALAAGREVLKSDALAISDLLIQRVLPVSDAPKTMQVILTPADQAYEFEIFSLREEEWICHATGCLARRNESGSEPSETDVNIQQLTSAYPHELPVELCSERLAERGLMFGPAFLGITALYQATEDSADGVTRLLGRVEPPASITGTADYLFHPALFDACLRVLEAAFPNTATENEDNAQLYLPVGITALQLHSTQPSAIWVEATARTQGQTRFVDFRLFDDAGQTVARIDELYLRPVPMSILQRELFYEHSITVDDDWFYHLDWQLESGDASKQASGGGSWLILADQGTVHTELTARFDEQQVPYTLVFAGENNQQLDAIRHQLNPNEPAAFDHLLTDGLAEKPCGIVHLWGMDQHDTDTDLCTTSMLHLVQALVRTGTVMPLYLVTRGVQAIGAHALLPDLWQASLWGLARVIHAEHPELSCTNIDLPAEDQGIERIQALYDELWMQDGETQVAFRAGQRYVARLTQTEFDAQAAGQQDHDGLRIDPDGCYLVTGGLGSVGLQMAEQLVSEGARHLLLMGRSGVTSSAQQTVITQLEEMGATVHVVKADISDADAVKCVINGAPKPLRGVIHAAGVLDDGVLMEQTAQRFAKVAAPKIQGAWYLHTHTQSCNLDFFVLFSSVTSLLGTAGQANYAAANAFLDTLAHYRRSLGQPALSINWGPWEDRDGVSGMTAKQQVQRRVANEGWQIMTGALGWKAIERLWQQGIAQAGVLPLEWPKFMQSVPSASGLPVLAEIASAIQTPSSTVAQTPKIAQQLQSATAELRTAYLETYLLERLAQTLRVSVERLDAQQSLQQLGMDSLLAVELRSWIRQDLSVDIGLETFLTTPTIHDLVILIEGAWQSLHSGSDSATKDIEMETASAPQEHDGASSWLRYISSNQQARLRLFCFPYAGGGASIFRNWGHALSDDIEVCAIQLPGREDRVQEAPITDLSLMVETLLPELQSQLDRPYALFGHSMGAVLAYEVARGLRQRNAPEPLHLFVSARPAHPTPTANGENMIDHHPHGDGTLHTLADQDFINELHHRYGAIPDAIRNSPELQTLFLPILRADVKLLEVHTYTSGAPLDYPISVLGGVNDKSVTQEQLAAWQLHTTRSFTKRMFAGDHFFINDAQDALLEVIGQELVGYL